MVRREILKVNDGPTTEALSLMQELLIYGKNHSEITILEPLKLYLCPQTIPRILSENQYHFSVKNLK